MQHPTVSPVHPIIVIKSKIQTLITQDHGEFCCNQAQEFMQLVLQSYSICSVNYSLVGLSTIPLELVSLKNQYYVA